MRIRLRDTYDLGAQFFLWEMATAVEGTRLGIQPFDQPNVESPKVGARRMVKEYLLRLEGRSAVSFQVLKLGAATRGTPEIRTMAFDLGGTLVRTELLKAWSYAEAAARLRPELVAAVVIEAFKDVVGRGRPHNTLGGRPRPPSIPSGELT